MSGTVRNQTDGKPVSSLEYQAYVPMAINIFKQLAQEIRQQWPIVNRVVIHHRTGHLTIGEISVLIGWAALTGEKHLPLANMRSTISNTKRPFGKKNTGKTALANGSASQPAKRPIANPLHQHKGQVSNSYRDS